MLRRKLTVIEIQPGSQVYGLKAEGSNRIIQPLDDNDIENLLNKNQAQMWAHTERVLAKQSDKSKETVDEWKQ